ncbi:MAG: hypothetical protein K2N14_03515 [Clostridia bacterium]|nr:hypothetical protein [Clostridia bacterium]
MKKKLSAVLIVPFFCVCALTILFCGCGHKDYRGKYPDLYTAAINSVLWNYGHSSGADFYCDSEIEILEKDEYGRTLYTYYEDMHRIDSSSSLIISQYSSEGYVYYYEDKNFCIKKQEPYSAKLQEFSQTEIEYLKSINDWGKELNLDKCTKKEIIRKKQDIPTDTKKIESEAIAIFNLSDTGYVKLGYLTSDADGNYIVDGYIGSDTDSIHFVTLLNSEGEVIDWLVPNDLYNYQEELMNFKQKNGWIKE